MAIFIIPKDCGNAPRKQWLIQWYRALSDADVIFLENVLVADFLLKTVFDAETTGVENGLKMLMKHPVAGAAKVEFLSLITHGTEAAAYGCWLAESGESGAFCDLFKFKSAGKNLLRELVCFRDPIK